MSEDLRWVELNWLFNVTINDSSVIYMTAHICAGGPKKLDLRSGFQRHRHFVGFFEVPVLAPTRDQPLYTLIPTHRLLRTRWGYGGAHSRLNPRALTGVEEEDSLAENIIVKDIPAVLWPKSIWCVSGFVLRGTWATEGEFSRETYQYNLGANFCHTEFDKIPVTIRPLALGAKKRITASSFGSVVMY